MQRPCSPSTASTVHVEWPADAAAAARQRVHDIKSSVGITVNPSTVACCAGNFANRGGLRISQSSGFEHSAEALSALIRMMGVNRCMVWTPAGVASG
jgi:hypothetical protein